MSEHRACEECIRLLEQVTSFVPSAAMDIDWDVGEAGYSEDFAYVIEQARAHLAVHANRTCEECGGKGKLPPITHERLVALLMEYPDASEAGIATLLSGAPCPCQEVK